MPFFHTAGAVPWLPARMTLQTFEARRQFEHCDKRHYYCYFIAIYSKWKARNKLILLFLLVLSPPHEQVEIVLLSEGVVEGTTLVVIG